MKTVVMGLFDDLDDARRVLAHLSSSPLDLDSIQVVHAKPEVQRQLCAAAGLPQRRTVRTGFVTGALLGAALGFVAGSRSLAGAVPIFTSLGPLLSMAVAAVAGALAGVAAGLFSESLRLPQDHAQVVAASLRDGATAITVQTENLPTARAISALFRDSGSRVFAPVDEPVAANPTSPPWLAPEAGDASPAAAPAPSPLPDAPVVPTEHLPYAPPWRRASTEEHDQDPGQPEPVDGHGSNHAPGDGTSLSPGADNLEALGLSPRTVRALRLAGVSHASQLKAVLAQDEAALLALRGIGPAAAAEIRARLSL